MLRRLDESIFKLADFYNVGSMLPEGTIFGNCLVHFKELVLVKQYRTVFK